MLDPMRRPGRPWALSAIAAALALSACTGSDPVLGQRAAVEGGDPSTRSAAVLVLYDDGSGTCGGAVVGPRHVLVPNFCATGTVRVAVGPSTSELAPYEVLEVRSGPPSSFPGNALALVITVHPISVEPFDLAAALPALDDELTVVGYGGRLTSRGLTEGSVRVTRADVDYFSAVGVGAIEQCSLDGTALDAEGRLAGIGIFGIPSTGNCFGELTYLAIPAFGDWIRHVIADPLPDAGPAPDAGRRVEADAGPAPDAGPDPMTMLDAGGARDAGPPPPEASTGCAISRARPGPVASLAWLAFALLLARRRSAGALARSASVALAALLGACGASGPTDAGTTRDDAGGTVREDAGTVREDAGPPSCDGEWPDDAVAYEEMFLAELNARRAAGVECPDGTFPPAPPLTMDPRLRVAARCHALYQAEIDSPTGEGADGSTQRERAAAAGYDGTFEAGLAGGTAESTLTSDGVAGTVDGVLGVPASCAAAGSPSVTDIGIGFAPSVPRRFRYFDLLLGR